jgi:transposase
LGRDRFATQLPPLRRAIPLEGTEPSQERYEKQGIALSEPSIVSLLQTLDLRAVEQVLLEAYAERGRRPPYPPCAMLRALIFQKIRQIPSWRKLASMLKHETTWLPILGFNNAPCHDSFSEFTRRVGPERFHRVFRILQSQLRASYGNLGERIAIDSTIVRGYSNPRKRKGSISDPDARWGVTGQKVNRPVHVFGYKLQVSCDADFGLPLDYLVVPANRSDSRLCYEILLRTKSSGNRVDVMIADAGYDSKRNILLAIKHHAIPIIKLNPRRSKDKRMRRADYILPVRRNSDEWNRYYNMRTSVERLFARLKTELGLEHLKLRSIGRVEVHFAICLITMLAIASTAVANGYSQLALCIEPWRYYG